VAAFSGTQLKAGPVDNMAKIVKAKVLIRFSTQNFQCELFGFAHAR
jgi:hypothetical protein